MSGALVLASEPIASQTELEAHETAERGPVPVGRVCIVQLAPPSVELRTTPGAAPPDPKSIWPGVADPPTAVHTDGEGHETAKRVDTA